jgi:hypothetical protein
MKKLFAALLSLVAGLNCCFAQTTPAFSAANSNEVERLMQVLTNENNFKTNPVLVAESIFKLGELKASPAIPLLVEHIDFYDPRAKNRKKRISSALDGRVAVDALIKVGKPSLEPVLKAATKEDARLRQTCMAEVVRAIEGKENGQRLVEQTSAALQDLAEKERLKKIADYISNPYPF